MIATLIAGLLLLILLLPGVLAYPERNGNAARDAFEAERLKVSNDLLQAQPMRCKRAAREKVCRADGTTSVDVPGFSPSEAGKQETAPGAWSLRRALPSRPLYPVVRRANRSRPGMSANSSRRSPRAAATLAQGKIR